MITFALRCSHALLIDLKWHGRTETFTGKDLLFNCNQTLSAQDAQSVRARDSEQTAWDQKHETWGF